MKSIKIRWIACVFCTVCIISCTGDKIPFTVQEATINEAVYASGEILPDPYVFVQSTSNEIINHICVNVGDYVKEGNIVAFLGSSKDDRQIAALRKQLEIAKITASKNSPILNELRKRIDAAKNQYDSDKKNAERYSALVQSKAVSQKDAEHYMLQAEASHIEYAKLQEQYEAKTNELSTARLEIENILAQASIALEDKILRSKIDGKVLSIPKRQGESVSPEEIIMLIGNDSRFQLKLIIDERDIHKIEIGQKIVFETNVYPNQLFYGNLRHIDPLIRTELRSVRAEASIEGDTFFYPQSIVEANIIIREKEKALLIPSDYLFAGDSVLLQDYDIQMKKVATGIRVGNNVEITYGVNKGDVIFKNRE